MEENIYEDVVIIVDDEKKKFNIRNIRENLYLFFGIKDLDTAIQVKQAYCHGYKDAKDKYKKED